VIADFTIQINAGRKPMAVQVKIHDDLRALRSAARKHTLAWNPKEKPRPDDNKLLGVCHRFHNDNDPLMALVRLAPPNLGVGILAHELTHAAVWLWEIENKFDEKLYLPNDDEWFCYVLGDLVHYATKFMQQKGIPMVGYPDD
jgi:hypothetical protein